MQTENLPSQAASHPLANPDFMFIGELARQTGSDPKTIRFYERKSLLSPPRHGRVRTYLASDVQRLKNVLRLRQMGVPIANIRALLTGKAGEADVLAIPEAATCLERHLEHLSSQQAELEQQVLRTRAAIAAMRGWNNTQLP